MTGYAAAKVVNEMLTARGLKNIPPQMVYNYLKKGYIKSTDIQDIEEWAEKYVAKKMTKV